MRPRAAPTPSTWKKLPVTSVPAIMRPSMRLSMSGSIAKASVKTLVSRRSASYCGRVNRLRLAVGRARTLDPEQLAGVGDLVDAEEEDVEEGEDDGHQAQAERHGRHDRESRQGRPPERADGVEDVTHAAVDERDAARDRAVRRHR